MHVSDLAGVEPAAPVDVVVDEEAAAHAEADVEVEEVAVASSGAVPVLAYRGGGRVVLEDHRHPHAVLHQSTQRYVLPTREVGWPAYRAVLEVQRPDGHDPGSEELAPVDAGGSDE